MRTVEREAVRGGKEASFYMVVKSGKELPGPIEHRQRFYSFK
jgi:hypothetical protein